MIGCDVYTVDVCVMMGCDVYTVDVCYDRV